MASKKSAVAAADVPGFLLEVDGNKGIARAKAALAKKWSLTKAPSVAEAVQLAWCLVALGRAKEAREVADALAAGVADGGDAGVWAAASLGIALAARLAGAGGDEARRASLASRLAARPLVPATPREGLAKAIGDAGKDVRSAEVEPSPKYALQGFANGCARATYFLEMAAHGGYAKDAYDVDALERLVTEGTTGLRAHLAR